MVEFMKKHPIIAYLMLDCVCTTVQNIVALMRQAEPDTKMNTGKCILFNSLDAIEKARNSAEQAKEPMGFHYSGEES